MFLLFSLVSKMIKINPPQLLHLVNPCSFHTKWKIHGWSAPMCFAIKTSLLFALSYLYKTTKIVLMFIRPILVIKTIDIFRGLFALCHSYSVVCHSPYPSFFCHKIHECLLSFFLPVRYSDNKLDDAESLKNHHQNGSFYGTCFWC